ncbi:M20 family metallopeptidase [Peribacillus sp. V2I11]|uniref:M20 family metallopeptidase n=1 Tax=Peribacillus sp. V2I11 TaxID=3042277 RepID=UPI002784C672|nr:M20 family metallopeptidase [Peribacillus sp. V2I11]MDQ0882260.1 amidohydrolase [Peribacillus sp. V2I11]
MSIHVAEGKKSIQMAVDARDAQLRELALNIHAHPELSFHEYKAVKWLMEPLKKAGFSIEKGVANLETSFRATWEGDHGGPTIAILAEYDALAGLGHGCGHNIIGTSAIGAALALKDAHPDLPGKIVVLGTPAEEEGGGKILMVEDGIFDHVDVAMMCHPQKQSMVLRGGLACVDASFRFYGKASHASSAPEKGISALDAVINTFVAINSLRQFFKDDVRIHGIITKGGDATNVVPAYCEAEFLLRASTVEELNVVREKVYAAARHATKALGARIEITEGLIYAERNNNIALAALFKDNLEMLGEVVCDPPAKGGIGSSDIGNVGQVTATIHPYIKITDDAITHTPEFVQAAASERGMIGLNKAAKALAMTAYEVCMNPQLLQEIREEFEGWKANKSCK